ncbi:MULTISPECIES: carbohydrate ABC transporter permease [unclassified Streptomyces]|uniref:Carbohydrate ABC transporter permease n=1 Tax=Streptomyces lonegramiae TaxID=3075524 RepID=A0ABU2X8P6_9ACTN|nr:carbohydrate ABC transporter permease [Streptomyces sp. DSM 41529]MDT0542283.1 carbohydrate ABC transporter permease [Streptomyces sp. DSM 41529]
MPRLLKGSGPRRPNYPAGLASLIWLVIVGAPLYVLVATTFRTRDGYIDDGPLSLPTHLTFTNYDRVLSSHFFTYLGNTLVVTAVCAAIVIVLSVTVGYAIVRARSRLSQRVFQMFLLGLAIPSQAVIIPIYLVITKLQLYDTLLAVILPTAAFSLPVSVLILAGTMRDIDEELYESMALDGAGPTRVLLRLVVPMSRAGISTVGVYSALHAWNGFMFPLILTQSRSNRVLTLGLYDYVGEFRVDTPALLTAVVLSIVPIFVVYLFARRQLINGLMGVGGK